MLYFLKTPWMHFCAMGVHSMNIKIGKNNIDSLIDKDDYLKFKVKGNFFNVTSHGYVRVLNYLGIIDGKMKYKQSYLHRMIMNPSKGLQVDHINGDRLDNRKSNLRICTSADNSRNRKNIKGVYKGVYFSKKNKNWVAQITKNYKCLHIGSFLNQEDAACAYNLKAKELHGEFAHLNNVVQCAQASSGVR